MSFTVKFLLLINILLAPIFLMPKENMRFGESVLIWAAANVLCLIYAAPGLIAEERGKKNSTSIWLLNAFLGWTGIGWVIALVWATTTSDTDKPQPELGDVPCPACYAPVYRYATKCRHCATDLKAQSRPAPAPINSPFHRY